MRNIAGSAPAPVLTDTGLPANYLDLYGLSKPPFGGPRQGSGFILFGSQKWPFESLIDHIVNGSGVVLLQGEEGVGKTVMLRAAGDVAAQSGVETIRISRPPAGRLNLTQFVASLGGPEASAETTADEAIQRFAAPPRKALLVDDVDLLPEDCLQLLLRLLKAMSPDPGGPAIVVSSAAPLTSDPNRPDLVELGSLVRSTIRMSRLGPAEVQQYIERSLWVAGGATRRLIAQDALKTIVMRSGGIAASVDRLMEAAFTAGFARGDSMITGKTIAAMSAGVPRPPRRRITLQLEGMAGWAFQIMAAVLLVSGASVFVYKAFYESAPRPTSNPVAKAAAPQQTATTAPSVQGQPQPPPPAALPKSAEPMAPELMAALLKRGDQTLSLGDTAAARLFFQHAADAGSAVAATAMGKTYDPYYVGPGEKPELARAADWYRRAIVLGDPRAAELLKRMETR